MCDIYSNPKVIEMKKINKKFGENQVLTDVDFDLHQGEVHALLGENGAGKTTLMNILFGLFPPTSGSIHIKGKEYHVMTPKIASENGIGMVHQHFMLIEPFTVTQNIILGNEILKGKGFIDYQKARDEIMKLSEQYGLKIDPDSKIYDISVGQQQRVEILKALYKGAEIIIFDEPTAVLTPPEIVEFENIIKNLTKLGKSIIIITHKLNEIKAMADSCTIIRRGHFIDKLKVCEVDQNILAEKMVGRNVSFKVEKEDQERGEKVLEVRDLHVEDKRGLEALKGLNLELHRGEILGIAGVDGNGQSELINALTGLDEIKSGSIQFLGEEISELSPRQIIDKGISTIPEDRQKRGLVLDFSIANNFILENVDKEPFSNNGILNKESIYRFSHELVEKFDIRPTNIHSLAKDLSGGNQQKVIIAREVSNDPDVLIAAQPTRGLDVGAIEFIHKYLVDQRNKNKAVLLISFELDEVMDLSDRIVVIYDGKIVGETKPEDTDEMEIGRLMAGGERRERSKTRE